MRTTRLAVVLVLTGLVFAPAPADASLISTFDVTQPTTVFPPETSTLPLEVTPLKPAEFIPIEIISLSLVSVDPLLDAYVQATGRNVGPLAGINFVSGTTPEDTFPVDSFFDIFIEIDAAPGGSVPRFGGQPPDDTIPGPVSSFSLEFDTVFNNSGTLHHQFLFEIADTQPDIQFQNVLITSFDTSIGIQFDYVGMLLPDLGQLFTLTMGGDFTPVPEPSTLVLWSLGAVTLAGIGWRRRKRAA